MSGKKMSARSSWPLESEIANNLARGSEKPKSCGESVGIKKPRRYVTTKMVESIAESMTDRDRMLLDLFTKVRLASGSQLRQIIWGEGSSAGRSARRQLAKLAELRLLLRINRRHGGVRAGSDGFVYVLDLAGQMILGHITRRRPEEPSLSMVNHGLAVTDCYLTLRRLESDGRLELVHFEPEPDCWRDYFGRAGARLTLKPDAFVVLGIGDWEYRWFLEVDRASERASRIKSKANAHIAYWQSGKEEAHTGVSPRVLWIAPDERRANQLVDILSSLNPDHWSLLRVTTDHGLAEAVTAVSEEQQS